MRRLQLSSSFPQWERTTTKKNPNVILLQRKQFVLALCTVCPVIALCLQVITPSSYSPQVMSRAVVSQNKAQVCVHVYSDCWDTFVRLNKKERELRKIKRKKSNKYRCANTCWKKSQPTVSILVAVVLVVACKYVTSAVRHLSL